jgi:hypothetical protein
VTLSAWFIVKTPSYREPPRREIPFNFAQGRLFLRQDDEEVVAEIAAGWHQEIPPRGSE